MGNEMAAYKMLGPLTDVLKANGTPLKNKKACLFLKEVGHTAPWFLEEGLLNIPQWEYLGEDLRRDPSATPGTLAVWSLVKVCLLSSREPICKAVLQGGEILEQVKEESCKGSWRDSSSESESSEESSDEENALLGDKRKVTVGGPSDDQRVEEMKRELAKKEEELKKAMAQLKMQGEFMAQLKLKVKEGAIVQLQTKEVVDNLDLMPTRPAPTAPPYEGPPPYKPCCTKACYCASCTAQNWREVLGPEKGFFPVMEDQHQQRYHQPLDFKLVKQLTEAVMSYGPQAAFTVSLVETLGSLYLTPEDWSNLARAVLSGGQYLEWKIQNQDNCQDTARRNAAAGNPQWNLDMLTGAGQYFGSQAQSNYPPGVYHQIATAALRAWKTLRGAGDLQGQLSKVLQGPNEPYADFVDRLIQTAGRMFGDVDQAMPLVKQLAFENANKWCREAI
ncbi:igE-binding protein-like [Mustela putorius furo]|uniref:IgE-binding protein-like n=1 Tax=Mustela putorius furo TaxID=9669 RepID=A0A8U0UY54_MUSPF|nr:igE-binding protein-like [Mustela putorius furo]